MTGDTEEDEQTVSEDEEHGGDVMGGCEDGNKGTQRHERRDESRESSWTLRK